MSDRESPDHNVQHYHNILRAELDRLAPLKCRHVPVRPRSDWYSEDIRQAQIEGRRLERQWKRGGLCVHKEMLRAQCSV